MNEIVRGATAGLAGTAVMSVAMLADRVSGFMRGELPPRKVSRHAEQALGVRDDLSQPAFEASWVAQHFAYGAAAGVAYEIMQSRLRLPEPVPAGAGFGMALWAAGYAGWLPVTGLYPPPGDDRKERVAMMVVHHLVYGITVAQVARKLRARDERSRRLRGEAAEPVSSSDQAATAAG